MALASRACALLRASYMSSPRMHGASRVTQQRMHQIDEGAQRVFIRDDPPAQAINVQCVLWTPIGFPGSSGNELAGGDNLEENRVRLVK